MLVRENISFERYRDPKKALGLSLIDEIKEKLEKFEISPHVGYMRIAHPLENYWAIVVNFYYSTTFSGAIMELEKTLEETGMIEFIENIQHKNGTEYVLKIKVEYGKIIKEIFDNK